MIKLDRDYCSDLATIESLEWIETNGIGGYAMGTVSGINSRRYHGLLIGATQPPLGRMLMLSKLEESVVIDGRAFDLSSNRYPDTVFPQGFRYFRSFRLDPFPTWEFDVDGVALQKRIFMPHGINATVVEWSASGICRIELLPLVAFRDHHHLRHEERSATFTANPVEGGVAITSNLSNAPLILQGKFGVEKTGEWYKNFEYTIEKERGFDFHEDLYQPFRLTLEIEGATSLIASTETLDATAADLFKAEMKRRAKLVAVGKAKSPAAKQLLLAADQFIVGRGSGSTVIAGYPWFSDWGRDTMIALSGLTLSSSRPEIARSILLEFSKHISQGMIPNRFPDEGDTPDYNTVDATLWYFDAVRTYVNATADTSILDSLYEKLVDVIEWHIKGTRYGIRMDDDGLLRAGMPGTQLTWMDAKVGDTVFTPRIGKPVEIQALWYNALRVASDFGTQLGDEESAAKFKTIAERVRFNFEPAFWNETDQCLYDVVDGESRDPSIRPNQILAVSLHHAIAEGDLARAIVDKVEAELLTPVGLRSLAAGDPRYVGVYEGSPEKRDSSYHQGTVWGWLIGPFIDAYRKVHAGEVGLEARVASMAKGLVDHLSKSGCLGQISEIFDGDEPHLPRGCSAQAWSVAELLRVLSS